MVLKRRRWGEVQALVTSHILELKELRLKVKESSCYAAATW